MNYKTHQVGGLLVGTATAVITTTLDQSQNSIYTAAVIPLASVVSSIWPDLDKAGTHASNRHPILHSFFGLLGHRGVSHSALIPLISLVAVFLYRQVLFTNGILGYLGFSIWLGLSVGYLSHLMFDIITPMGVPLFAPLSFKYYSILRLNNNRDGLFVLLFALILTVPLAVVLIQKYRIILGI